MKGSAPLRSRTNDPLLRRMLSERGLSEVPLRRHRRGGFLRNAEVPNRLAPRRDGPVAARRAPGTPAGNSAAVKKLALAEGAALAGVARLRPAFIERGVELPHDWIVCVVVAEDYRDALAGPDAIERGAHRSYALAARIVTRLARAIRARGYPALAHHNGANEILALPALHAAGIGELGRHGSLIHPRLGASWRAAFVTTTLPLQADAPVAFGVQDYCMHCRLCENACPGGAIAPAGRATLTEGIKRWLVDTEKCYPYSRLSTAYCHICVDVCPYIHKENGDADRKAAYVAYVERRKREGFNAPAPESPPAPVPPARG